MPAEEERRGERETLSSDPAPQPLATLPGYSFSMGHQETDRMVDELEQILKQVRQSAGSEAWMSADSAARMLCTNLGYEDEEELEDAIKGRWWEFLRALPHLETKIQDDGSFADGRLVFRLKQPPDVASRKQFIKTLVIKSRQDLWRVCHKAPCAVLEIPELEFEIGADAKRKIDSIYNHIAGAVYNLSMHVSTLGDQLPEHHKEKIGETVQKLNELLDVEAPFTLMLHDRTGISEIVPEEEVETQYGGPAEEDPIEAEEKAAQALLDAIDEGEDPAAVPSEQQGEERATVLDVD